MASKTQIPLHVNENVLLSLMNARNKEAKGSSSILKTKTYFLPPEPRSSIA